MSGAIDEAREAQKVGAQTGAVLKSTGAIANVSAKQVEKLSGALSEKIGVDDEAIQAGQNMLLTFTKVRNEVGKGNDIFNQATRTVQDMAAAFGGDAVTQSKALGKALNDPVKGVTALTRVGVQFTDAQKEQIKTLVESGNILGAQKIILRELAIQTKGSAEAQATNADKARVAYQNLQEQVGTALLPVFDRMASVFTNTVAPAVSKFVTEMQKGTGTGGQFRDVLASIGSTVKGVATFFAGLPGPVKAFGVEAAAAALILPRLSAAINGVSTAVGFSTTKIAGWRRGMLLAAGVGGLVAITEGARTGNKQVSLLGGALTGAFVGGTLGSAIPGVGTAIGAAGGFAAGAAVQMFRMHRAADAAGESSKGASPKVEGLAESLNQVTGAATRATKALILQKLTEDGITISAGQLGIANSDLIKSVLGNEKAIERVNTAWEKNGNLLDGLTNQKVSEWLTTLRAGLSKSEQSVKDANAALDGTDRKSKKAADALKGVGKARPGTDKWEALYSGDLDRANTNTDTFARSTRRLLGEEVGKARANMKPFTGNLISQLGLTKGRAKTAGTGIGNAIESGVNVGLNGLLGSVVAQVNDAIAAAQAAAGGKGGGGGGKGGGGGRPSTPAGGRVSAEGLGRTVGEGVARGIAGSTEKVGQATEKLTKKVKEKLATLHETLKGLKSEFADLVEPIKSAFTGDLFEATTAKDFVASLLGTKGQLTGLIAAFKTLIGQGLSPKFLYDLFQSGNAGLILDLAKNPELAAQAGGLFGDINQLSTQLGQSVAGATPDGKAITAKIDKTNAKLDKLMDHVDRVGAAVGREVNGAASNGRRRAA